MGAVFMNNLRISRSLWLFAGTCFIVAFMLSIESSKSVFVPTMNGIACILMFINAYISHRKIKAQNKKVDD